MTIGRGASRGGLALILLIALAWRLNHIGFGLPSMYDPDEPMFMITALKMLQGGTLNPGWFGHPGSTTIYLLALIDVAVVGFGLLSGHYANIADFTLAAYADPGLLFVPSRVAMALIGVGVVWLTYLLASRLHGRAAGLIASGLLAINGLHIAWSQVVRTDIQASLFMIASTLFAVRAAERGRVRDYLLAGAFAGFAIATKWPSASVFIALVGATAYRIVRNPDSIRREFTLVVAGVAALLAGVFVASPFIFLDWQTVLGNVAGEMKAGHLSHTGGSFLDNLGYYLWHPVRESVGLVGLALIIAGAAVSAARSPIARWTMVPAAFAFLFLICSQGLIWSRWILPILPFFLIFAAAALVVAAETLSAAMKGRVKPGLALAVLAAAAAIPSLLGAIDQSRERANDTRAQAARWAEAHIPAGSTVVLEHLELSLRDQPWTILFPIGAAGCVDGVRLIKGGVDYDKVQQARRGSPIIDLGNVGEERLESCRADYAILTYYDLYRAEMDKFPAEMKTYQKLLAGGRTVALFAPRSGHAGGPLVRIVSLRQQ